MRDGIGLALFSVESAHAHQFHVCLSKVGIDAAREKAARSDDAITRIPIHAVWFLLQIADTPQQGWMSLGSNLQ